MKKKITRSEVQRALNGLSAANNRALKWRNIIMAYSVQEFGCEPGDVDNDNYIDSCDGGCGPCIGMTVDEFDNSMRECLKDGE